MRSHISFPGIAHNWSNHKKSLGEAITMRFKTHKQFLRKHKLGKFAKRK